MIKKSNSWLISIVSVAVIGITLLLGFDTLVSFRLKKSINEFNSLATKIKDDVDSNSEIDKLASEKLAKLQEQTANFSKELNNKTEELNLRDSQIQALKEELVSAKAACGDPEKDKAEELKLKLEAALGINESQPVKQ